jgi:Zn-dependent peptidase ImmA (M78 family)
VSASRWPSDKAATAARRLSAVASGRANIVALAKSLRRRLEEGPAEALLEAAMEACAVTAVRESGSLDSAGLLLDLGSERFIFVKEGLDRGTRNWTVAHELAHTILDVSLAKDSTEFREMERRCELFAQEFLLPKASFLPVMAEEFVNGIHAGVVSAAARTGVPVRSIVIRLRDLGGLAGTRSAVAIVRAAGGSPTLISHAADPALGLTFSNPAQSTTFGFDSADFLKSGQGEVLQRMRSSVHLGEAGTSGPVRSGLFSLVNISSNTFLLGYEP